MDVMKLVASWAAAFGFDLSIVKESSCSFQKMCKESSLSQRRMMTHCRGGGSGAPSGDG